MITDVFCKIINGELPAEPIYKDEDFMVIRDIHPQAPVHLLVIPLRHTDDLADFIAHDQKAAGLVLEVIDVVAKQEQLAKGYRVILNEGEHGGKLVPHLHFHILGGKRLGPKIVQ